MVGRAGDELVLAGRRGRALADAAAGQERAGRQRRGGHGLPRDLLDLHRHRFGSGGLAGGRTHHSVADLDRRGAARPVRHRSRLVDASARRRPRLLAGYFGDLRLGRGIRFALDLAGLAIAGGLFIVPTFAAVQAWAGADRRARVVAAVNVLNAAFMAGSTVIVAMLQKSGMTTSQLFLRSASRALPSRSPSAAPCRRARCSDALSIIYRALFRIEVRGIENLNKAGPNVIIALNHVSLLDAGLAMSLRDREPVFAIDVGIAQKWWVRPFLQLTHAMPLDPMKPMAIRTLIDAVKAGDALIIFPEGRITVTGSLMKVYDGAAMIADKSDAEIVPVRIEGLEQTPFSRLSKDRCAGAGFPR